MNLSHVVTIGTFRGGSVGGLEEGKGVQPILGRKNRLANTKSAESCTQKMRSSFSQIYHHLLKFLTSLFDILRQFFEISSINLTFISLKLMTILRSEKKTKIFENLTTWHFCKLQFHQAGISLCFWPLPNISGRKFQKYMKTKIFWSRMTFLWFLINSIRS